MQFAGDAAFVLPPKIGSPGCLLIVIPTLLCGAFSFFVIGVSHRAFLCEADRVRTLRGKEDWPIVTMLAVGAYAKLEKE
jgi:hypothetical protein